ncbi:Adenylyl-sulfate kinase, partial [Podochytrium sp. JEL0797]
LHDEAGIPFVEVFADVPIEVAEQRDPKGLYKKARQGIIKDFTGISSPYEAPAKPEIHIRTDLVSIEDGVRQIVAYLEERGLLQVSVGAGSKRAGDALGSDKFKQ